MRVKSISNFTLEMSVRKQLKKCGKTLNIKVSSKDTHSAEGCEIRKDSKIYIKGIPVGKIVKLTENDQEETLLRNDIEVIDEQLENLELGPRKRKEMEAEKQVLEERKEKIPEKNKNLKILNEIVRILFEMKIGVRPFNVFYPPENQDLSDELVDFTEYSDDNVNDIKLQIVHHIEHNLSAYNNIPFSQWEKIKEMIEEYKQDFELQKGEPKILTKQELSKSLDYPSGNLQLVLSKLDLIVGTANQLQVWDNLRYYKFERPILPGEGDKFDFQNYTVSMIDGGNFDEKRLTFAPKNEHIKENTLIGKVFGRIISRTEIIEDDEFRLQGDFHRRIKIHFPEELFPTIENDYYLDTFLFETYMGHGYPFYTGLFDMSNKDEEINSEIVQKLTRTNDGDFEDEDGVGFDLSFFLYSTKEIKINEEIVVKGNRHAIVIPKYEFEERDEPGDYPETEGPQDQPDKYKFDLDDAVVWSNADKEHADTGKQPYFIMPVEYKEMLTHTGYNISNKVKIGESERIWVHQNIPENELTPYEPEKPPNSPMRRDESSDDYVVPEDRETSSESEFVPELVNPEYNDVVEWEKKPGKWILVIIRTLQLKGKKTIFEVFKKSKNKINGKVVFTSANTKVGDKFRTAPEEKVEKFMEDFFNSNYGVKNLKRK